MTTHLFSTRILQHRAAISAAAELLLSLNLLQLSPCFF